MTNIIVNTILLIHQASPLSFIIQNTSTKILNIGDLTKTISCKSGLLYNQVSHLLLKLCMHIKTYLIFHSQQGLRVSKQGCYTSIKIPNVYINISSRYIQKPLFLAKIHCYLHLLVSGLSPCSVIRGQDLRLRC